MLRVPSTRLAAACTGDEMWHFSDAVPNTRLAASCTGDEMWHFLEAVQWTPAELMMLYP